MKTLSRLADHPRYRHASNGHAYAEDSVRAAIARIEQITATWSDAVRVRLRPVIAAAKDGAIATEPAQIYLYLLGAFHTLNLDEETWESVDGVLDCLLVG